MTQTAETTAAAGPAPRDPDAARLDAAARAALHAADGDPARALPLFLGQLEREPDLLLALLGRKKVEDKAHGLLIRTLHSIDGLRLRKARVERKGQPADPDAAKKAREEVSRLIASSALYTVLVDGRPLAYATRADVERERARSSQVARFLVLVLEALPDDPGAVVGACLVVDKAEELWKRSVAQ